MSNRRFEMYEIRQAIQRLRSQESARQVTSALKLGRSTVNTILTTGLSGSHGNPTTLRICENIAMRSCWLAEHSNSPGVATGSDVQILPPRPPALGRLSATVFSLSSIRSIQRYWTLSIAVV